MHWLLLSALTLFVLVKVQDGLYRRRRLQIELLEAMGNPRAVAIARRGHRLQNSLAWLQLLTCSGWVLYNVASQVG